MSRKKRRRRQERADPVTNVKNTAAETAGLMDDELLEWLGVRTNRKKSIQEATYYTCLRILSEAIGKLPIKYYQETERGKIRAEPTEVTRLLTRRPNPYMTPTQLFTTVEANCQHYGNGYIWIQRGTTDTPYGPVWGIKGLYPMQSSAVTVWFDDAGVFGKEGGLYYQYSDPRTGRTYMFSMWDVVHIKTWCTFDGIMGKSVSDILRDTVGGSLKSQEYMNKLYEQGLTAAMALQYTGDLDNDRIRKLQRKFADKLTGSAAAGKVIPIPIGLQLQPLNIKLTDAQFFELKKYSALQIAAAFGIKPNQINNYDKSSYANSEMQQIDFLTDTELYRLKTWEEELNAKLLLPSEIEQGRFYKFNEKAILRTDSKTQMEIVTGYVQNGLYTPNEGRELLDKEWRPEGDVLMANGNYIPLEMIGTQYSSDRNTQEGGGDDGNS